MSTVKGIAVIMNMTLQLFTPSVNNAIKICPNPHPIDNIIGTDPLET